MNVSTTSGECNVTQILRFYFKFVNGYIVMS